ncbi:hypothetical protein FZ983_24485 [Azospirillum sp. B21]|uniref:hypothetical protein n=1 Tax=unclassified Azospirillum TaxID=2630922 RepID=UPI0011F058D4|nr:MULTISPECIES: hypothetical protein [unclassified Azospirillum]KAA0576214.1 hypothetical protein FZ983_24485 [Azospirillum sp. B21]MDR6775700.1 hypothetical protein [Azospirillum sp. BE72]
MKKLTKFIGLTAQFLYEVSDGELFSKPPAPVVVTERTVYTGETLQLKRQASLAGGYYRVFLKPSTEGVRQWFSPRLNREEAVATFSRMARRLA